MKYVLVGLLALGSISALAQDDLYFKGIENKKDGKTIVVSCGQGGLEDQRCQFVEISPLEPTNPPVLLNEKDFSHEEVVNIVDKTIKQSLNDRHSTPYLVTSSIFDSISIDNPACSKSDVTGFACDMRWVILGPSFGLASFVLESAYEGVRGVVVSAINYKRVKKLHLNVVRISNKRYEKLKVAVESL